MSRRSTPQVKIDEGAFPVRVLIFVPERGFVSVKPDPHQWLAEHIGRTEFAWHSGGRRTVRDSVALYFRHPQAAISFLNAFPSLELADGTTLPTYRSPYLPFGRK